MRNSVQDVVRAGRETVTVVSAVKGQHRSHCLCYGCEHFRPGTDEHHCPIAQAVYANCVKHGLVTPVYECPKFEAVTDVG